MPNVDECVRNCEKALCAKDNSAIKKICQIIVALPENNKVNVLKSKNLNELENYLINAQRYIKHSIAFNYYKNTTNYDDIILSPSSNNNKDGADLIHILPNHERIQIEVKFGAKTDGQIGMRKFDQIFGCNIFTEGLKNSVGDWQAKYLSEHPYKDKQFLRLWEILNVCVEGFNQYIETINHELPTTNQKFMETELINNSGAGNYSDYYMRFDFKHRNPQRVTNYVLGEGKWLINDIQKLKRPNGELTERIHVVINNFSTRIKIRFTLNWKNDKTIGNIKTQAKLGLGSPSWNFWVTLGVLDWDE